MPTSYKLIKKNFLVAICLLFSVYVSAQQQTPRQLFPGLFEAVQSSDVFPDNKTFVDCTPKYSPSLIMKAYNEQLGKAGFNLKEFVMANFTVPGGVTHAFTTN